MRRFVFSALAFIFAACASAPLDQSTAQQLRAMTFNIRYGTAPDGNHVWALRRDVAFKAIRDFQPTVLGVQEALRFQLDEMVHALPDYAEVGVGRDDGRTRGEYSAILYDRRRLDVLEHGTFWLSDRPEVPGSMTWGNRYPRVVTWARFNDRAAQTSFYVFNTHWDHESQPARERSAALTLQRIRQRHAASEPVLVMGDFNAGEDNPAFKALLGAEVSASAGSKLYDTFRAVHADARDVGTYHAFRGDRTGAKIDAILASSEWHTIDAAIVLLREDGRYPSDHFPVVAVLVQRARPPPRK